MSFEVFVESGRGVSFDVQLFQDDESTESTPTSSDVIRFKMGRRLGTTPALDFESDNDTNNVSFTADTNNVTVTLLEGDTKNLTAGPYEAEVAVVDASDSNRIKTYEYGTVHVAPTLGGDTANP